MGEIGAEADRQPQGRARLHTTIEMRAAAAGGTSQAAMARSVGKTAPGGVRQACRLQPLRLCGPT
jgi:hypothetical protein